MKYNKLINYMPSQTQIFYDINTLYTRYEASGTGTIGSTISYYGYSVPGTPDGAPAFSLKKVYYLGAVQYVDWANNEIGTYECSWTNRSAYFGTPSNISLNTATYTPNGNSTNTVTFTWIAATGASRYSATILKGNTLLTNLNDAGGLQYNQAGQNLYNKTFVNLTSVTLYNCPINYTYSINIYAYNAVGSTPTATQTIAT